MVLSKKVVPFPKKVDSFSETVDLSVFLKKKSPLKRFFLAHLEKKVYLCEPLTLRVSQLKITLKFI